MSWRIELYEGQNGQTPVEDFIHSLQPVTIAKLRNQLRLLEEFGPRLGMPNAKPIGDGLFELRIRGKEEVRMLYIYIRKSSIVILHGFKKKTMSIGSRDLRTALNRKKEIDKNNL